MEQTSYVPSRESELVNVLILIDQDTYDLISDGRPVIPKYSHDKNLLQFAHEAIRKGYSVYFSPVQQRRDLAPNKCLSKIYPEIEINFIDSRDVTFDIVVSVFPESLNIRSYYPDAVIVAIHAAVQWVETPENLGGQYLHDLITALRYNVDFIITQNERMRDLLAASYALIAKWPYLDRILVCPLGIVEAERREVLDRRETRRQMRVADDQVAIINSGGVWRWTDFSAFLQAFCIYVRQRPKTKLVLFIMGLCQPGNMDHDEYLKGVEETLYQNRDLVGDKIRIINDWRAASGVVKSYTAAADVGLNLNKESLENWQSYRLRFLDYMYYGVPVINTLGDAVSISHSEALYPCQAGNVQSYVRALRSVEENRSLRIAKSGAMKKIAAEFDSERTYGAALEKIVQMGRRPTGDFATWKETVLDYTIGSSKAEFSNALKEKILSFIR